MNDPTPRLNFGRAAIKLPPTEASPTPSQEAGGASPAKPLALPATPKTRPSPGKRAAATAEVIPANPMLDEVLDEVTVPGQERSDSPRKPRAGRSTRSSRFVVTEEHLEVLRWIDKARYTSNEQITVYMDKDLRWTRKMLGKLEGFGYVKHKQYPGYSTAYYLTKASKDLLDSETREVDEATGPGSIRHTFAIGWVMLGFLKGQVEWAATANKMLGRPVELDDFISEPEVVRSANKRWGELMDGLERQAKRAGQKQYVKKWEGWEALREEAMRAGAADEEDASNSYLMAAFGPSGKPHYPDLILKLPRDPASGKPRTLAIELERSLKPASVDSILNSYSEAMGLRYGSCLWLCGDGRVNELVRSKIQTRGLKSHSAGLASSSKQWKVAYLADLEKAAQDTRARNAAARAKGLWHVTEDLRAVPCRCGETCRARYGSHANQSAALALLDELA